MRLSTSDEEDDIQSDGSQYSLGDDVDAKHEAAFNSEKINSRAFERLCKATQRISKERNFVKRAHDTTE